MKIAFLTFCYLLTLTSQAQVFDAKDEWFKMTSFFYQKKVAKHHIQQIHIKIQSKNDGEAILNYSDFLRYYFNVKGQLVRSEKSIQLGHTVDTAQYIYHYNSTGQMVRSKEIQRNINYSYVWFYQQGLPYREVKLDENSILFDTLYNRRLISEKTADKFIVKTLNDKGLPFKIQTKTYRDGQLKSKRIDYVRNQNYQEIVFGYEGGQMVKKSLHSQFAISKDSYWIFTYKFNQLVSAVFYNGNKRKLKRLYTYNQDGFLTDVIERNFIEKSLRIYYFTYKYNTIHPNSLGKRN